MSIRAVVVEDSLVQRRALVQLLQEDGGITVVGEAGTVDEALAIIGDRRPDVVTMDLEIPGGVGPKPGGIVAIERLASAKPARVLVLSGLVRTRQDTLAIEALAAGALDVFPKAPTWGPDEAAALRRRVGVVSRIGMVTRHRPLGAPPVPTVRPRPTTGGAVVGVAASTGGPSALRAVIGGLAGLAAPILVVQHIHADFTASFATWLQDVTGVPTVLAEDDMPCRPGRVHVAPSDTHLRLGPGRRLALHPEPKLLSRPSGDELLASLAAHAGEAAVGAVLTGMGEDGAKGLMAIRLAGGQTFAQDSASSVVDGMPRVARESGAAQTALPVGEIAAAIREAVGRRVPAK